MVGWWGVTSRGGGQCILCVLQLSLHSCSFERLSCCIYIAHVYVCMAPIGAHMAVISSTSVYSVCATEWWP